MSSNYAWTWCHGGKRGGKKHKCMFCLNCLQFLTFALSNPGWIHMASSAQRTLIMSHTRSSCQSIWLCSRGDPSSGRNFWREKARCRRMWNVSVKAGEHTGEPAGVRSCNKTQLKLNFPPPPPSVKRYVRKGIPNEHRALIWMAASGAQDQLDKNPGYYQSLLGAHHDPKLVETICTGRARSFFSFTLMCTQTSLKGPGHTKSTTTN